MEFSQEEFEGRNESLARSRYDECHFKHCNFTEVSFQHTYLLGCTFTGCQLSLVKLDGCRLQNVTFKECKLVGLEFFRCDPTFFSASFSHSKLMGCNFSGLGWKKPLFEECQIEECFFKETKLIESNFSGSSLQGTLFHNCDLTKANFKHAQNYAIDPHHNQVKKAQFSFPEVIGLLNSFEVVIDV